MRRGANRLGRKGSVPRLGLETIERRWGPFSAPSITRRDNLRETVITRYAYTFRGRNL